MVNSASSRESLVRAFERLALPIVVAGVLLTVVMANQLIYNFEGFTTDLGSFAPETEADAAEERISTVMDSSPHMIYIHVEPYIDSAEGGNECDETFCNVLEFGALQQLSDDLSRVEEFSAANGDFVIAHLNTADMMERALEERDEQGRNLADFNDWGEFLGAVTDGDKCADAIGNDQAIASASFAASAMLHTDFDYEPVCEWLDTGEGDPTPRASSTMWAIEISGDISDDVRQNRASQIRALLDLDVKHPLGNNSALQYGVISDDLISHDINESTLDNLVWLLLIAVMVVVLLLAVAFRSFMMVAAPLLGLSAALVWTYGIMTVIGVRFSVLEVAVAPVVLGLGIDYSIHVWRRFEANRLSGMGTWQAMRDMYATTGTALLLSAGTTICGFLVLKLSPIPVIQDFGIVSSISVLFSLMMALFVLPGLLAAEVRSGNGYD